MSFAHSVAHSLPRHPQVISMRIRSIAVFVVLANSLCSAAEPVTSPLPRSSPEAQGISSAAVLAFIEAADKDIDAMNSFMLLRHGNVVAEGWWAPYNARSPHSLYSLSKSFTSTAVGLAIDEGKLSLDDEVLKFFPEDAPAKPETHIKAMRVRDLLRMNTGHQVEPERPPGRVWTKVFLAQSVPHKPGSHFLYNTSATYMLSAIVQKVTGTTVLSYLRPRLFEPLGVEDPEWGASPQGITLGGYGLSIRTEDIARFGQLYLQKGKWHGKQIVPASWVEAATAGQTSNGSNPNSDWDQGYGYQFWRSRHGAYRGDGAFGQYCIVMPDQDAVIAITSGVNDMQAVLNLVWDKLLPAIKSGPLPADDESRKKLELTLAHLTLRPQEGSASPSTAPNVKYVFPANDRKVEAISLEHDDRAGAVILCARIDGVEQRISSKSGTWTKARMAFGPMLPEQPVAASGGWTGGDTFKAKLCFFETPFIITLTLKFEGDQLLFESRSNVGFRRTQNPRLVGKAVNAPVSVARWRQHDIERPRPPVVESAAGNIALKPPEDAIILFDGTNLDAWKSDSGGPAKWRVTGGVLETVPGAGMIETKERYGDIQLHVEWAAPLPAVGKGQGRGNSGVFLMGDFEIQVLDSFKADTYADGQAGAIYGQYPPLFNASRPPGEWQTYDIAFRRPRFDSAAKLIEPARITVFYNGILVQNNEEPFGSTAWLKWQPYTLQHGGRGPIALQDHDHPVQYRNIWLRELPDRPAPTAAQMARPKTVALPQELLDRYSGRYLLGEKPDSDRATIAREGDHLTLKLPFRPDRLALEPISEKEFDMPFTDGRFTFHTDSAGKVTGVHFRIADSEREMKRVGGE
jgi:CubicO group peptidase (beta-lactamase class C family)